MLSHCCSYCLHDNNYFQYGDYANNCNFYFLLWIQCGTQYMKPVLVTFDSEYCFFLNNANER